MVAVETRYFISLNDEVRMQTFKIRALDKGYAMYLQMIKLQTNELSDINTGQL